MGSYKRIIAKILILVMVFTSIGFVPARGSWATEEVSDSQNEKHSITVYLSISEDGCFVTGNDKNKTVMSRVPVTIEYFDLAEYGLQDFYRYESAAPEDGGAYIGDTVLQQPTVLHLIIKAVEQYYLGGEKVTIGTDALDITGSATSMYMKHFWGHDENLMYFINHAYPLMKAGWGSTADYILLEDGMEIDIAMFSDWNFYTHGAFAYFTPTKTEVKTGESVTLQMKGVSTHEDVNGKNSVEVVMANEDVVFASAEDAVNGYHNGFWEHYDGVTDENGQIALSFDKPGTYYISSSPYYETFPGENEAACVAPPVATITVTGDVAEEDTSGTENLTVLSDLCFTEKTSTGSTQYSLAPKFDAKTDNYTLYVPDYVDSIAVWGTPTAESSQASAEVRLEASYTDVSGMAQKPSKKAGTTAGLNLAGLFKKGESQASVNLAATCGLSKQEYTVNIVRVPSLSELKAKDEAGSLITMDKPFSNGQKEYQISLPAAAKGLNLSMQTTGKDYKITVNGTNMPADEDIFVPLTEAVQQSVEICVEGTNGQTTLYVIEVNKKQAINCCFDNLIPGATVQLSDHQNRNLYHDTVTSTTLSVVVQEDSEYTYKISLKGYESKSGTFTANAPGVNIDGSLIELNENPEIDVTIPSIWASLRNNKDNNGITNAKAPVTASQTQLLWASDKGGGWSGAPSSPILVGEDLVFTTNKEIVKVNRVTGEITAKNIMISKSAFSLIPPTYADGMIFVALAGGRVQAFDAKSLKSLWVYQDSLGGQPNTPILYHDGYVYTGFWNSETKDANYVGLLAADENIHEVAETKTAAWTHTHKGGFYWAGAIATESAIIVGSENGKEDETISTGSLYAFHPASGKILDCISNIDGDIRSSIIYDRTSGMYHFVSRGGSFYSLRINEDGTFDRSSLCKIALEGSATSTPVIYNGRAYIGVSGKSNLGAYSGHHIAVIDLANQSTAYRVPTRGYPQASGVLTNGYEEESGYVYVYFVENYTPGVIRILKDKAGQTTAILSDENNGILGEREADDYKSYADTLFTPRAEQANFAIGSPIVDEYGTMYFKNDSSYVMALGSKIESLEVVKLPDKTEYQAGEIFDPTGMQVVANLANGMTRDVTDYVIYSKEPLTEYDLEIEIIYPYVMYNDKEKKSDRPATYIPLASINNEEIDKVQNVISLIDQIKDAEHPEEASISARAAYNELGTKLQKYVYNVDTLIEYEVVFAENNIEKGALNGIMLKAEAEGYQSMNLIWDSHPYASGYEVYRSTTAGQRGALVKTINDKETTTLRNSGLTTGKVYYYTVRPFILVDGQPVGTIYSNQAEGCTTVDAPVLKVSKNGIDSIKVSWQQISGATGYQLYRNAGSGFRLIKTFIKGSDLEYVDTGLLLGKTYRYKVKAVRNDAESSFSSEASLKMNLGRVNSVKAVRNGYASLKISWKKVEGAEGYRIYRYNTSKKKYILVKTIKSNKTFSYYDKGLKTGITYQYKVCAYRGAAVGGYSAVAKAKPTLSAVSKFKATPKKKQVKLTWAKTSGANGYIVYRSTKKAGKYKQIKVIKNGKTVSFTQKNLKKGKKYYYKIRAYRVVSGKKVYSTTYAGPKYAKVK